MIGKAGNTLRELQERTNTKILVAAREGMSENRTIHLRGSQAQIDHAKMLIAEKTGIPVEKMPNKAAQVSVFQNQSQGVKPSQFMSKVLQVPHEHVGLLIGKGGETLRNLKTASGADISIQKEIIPGTSNRAISLTGQRNEVEQAIMLIMSKVPAAHVFECVCV